MKRILLLTTAIAFGTAAYAQQGNPGAHFLEKWDSDEDGQVTLVEVIERRGDIFTTFDEGDDGFLSAKDYIMFDEARANDQAAMKAAGQGQGQGGEGQAMTMEFNDVNNDGQVSRDEFLARANDWYAQMDRNGDGTVTKADFGRGNN